MAAYLPLLAAKLIAVQISRDSTAHNTIFKSIAQLTISLSTQLHQEMRNIQGSIQSSNAF